MPHDTRDNIVDFVRSWAEKCDLPQSRFLTWIGIGSSKFWDWKLRFGKVNEHNAWVPRDHWLTDDEREAIRAFARSHPDEGYRRLTFMMLDADVAACSPASVYRVLKAANLLGATPHVTKKGTGFVQPLEPHQHWHIDISYLNIAGTFYFLCSVLDGCSRFLVHWEIRETMGENDVETILQRARERFPDQRPRLISDNGPQFVAKDFKEFIRIAGMTHVRTSPYHPQSNGKLERWHKTLKGDCVRPLVPLSLDDARRIVANWITHYNDVRLHSAIGYVAPRDRLDGRHLEIFRTRDRKLAEARERRKLARQVRHEQKCHDDVTHRPAIDFAAVRAAVTMSAVLQLLGVPSTGRRGAQQRGPCPLHGSANTSRCFSANLDTHLFHCFKCGRSGNALDLWAHATQQNILDAVMDLCARLAIPLPTLRAADRNREEEPVALGAIACTMT